MKPMTVGDMIAMLQKVENPKRLLSWADADGTVGYFYAESQKDFDAEAIDGGEVHLEIGGCPE